MYNGESGDCVGSELSRKIKELRLVRDMTLEQVANIVGVGKSTVRKWETGDISNMRIDKVDSLAKALGVSPVYLMGWNPTETKTPDEPKLTEGEEAMLNLFKKIPENKQKVVLEIIRLALKTQE